MKYRISVLLGLVDTLFANLSFQLKKIAIKLSQVLKQSKKSFSDELLTNHLATKVTLLLRIQAECSLNLLFRELNQTNERVIHIVFAQNSCQQKDLRIRDFKVKTV